MQLSQRHTNIIDIGDFPTEQVGSQGDFTLWGTVFIMIMPIVNEALGIYQVSIRKTRGHLLKVQLRLWLLTSLNS